MAVRAGIRAALEPYLVGTVDEEGEVDARCPLHGDKRRSARFNFEKNLWHCFKGCGSGKITDLVKRMREEGTTSESPVPRGSRGLRVVETEEVDLWYRALLTNPEEQERLYSRRDIRLATIRRYRIGWDAGAAAFTIPIYDAEGNLFNVRKYRPDMPADKKIFWAVKTTSDLPLYPMRVLSGAESILLCEGETDALIANQYGFPAVSGTAGAGTWHVGWSKLFEGKRVFIVYDRDAAGEKGARQVAEALEPFAKSIRIARIPINKTGADVTDYFANGGTKRGFRRMLKRAAPYEKRIINPMRMDPVPVSVIDSFSASNIGRRMTLDVHISGRSSSTYDVPKVVRSECTMDAGPRCKVCPMLGAGGTMTHEIEPWSPTILAAIGSPDNARNELLRKHIKAVKCDRLRHDVLSYNSVEELYVRPSWDVDSSDFTNRQIYGVGKHDTMPSQTVRIEGTTWPNPKDQRNAFLAWSVTASENAIDEFRPTPDIVSTLRQFAPEEDETPLKKLWSTSADIERYVTRIYGRRDLHMLMLLTLHSLSAFYFEGREEPRGWLDSLVVGDTRTGKSEAASRLIEYVRAGKVVNCEAATFAGVVAALTQHGGKNEWTIQWGVIPMNDRRLVVMDEASGLTTEEISRMSDIRSAGKAVITKVVTEEAWARTRLLWLSNPREDSLDSYTYGVQAIPPLIGKDEDIARFDLAMSLSSAEVSMASIHAYAAEGSARHSGEDLHALTMWAWSRTKEDVRWDEGSEREVIRAAEWLGERYAGKPPLIQPANVRLKVARVAAALAATTFSSDRKGAVVIIRKEHVWDALRFIHGIYRKESFGYWQLSAAEKRRQVVAVGNMDEVKRLLQERGALRRFLFSVDREFQRDMLEQMMNVSRDEANGIINTLGVYGMVLPNTRAVKIQPPLRQILRELNEEEMSR